MIRRSLGVLALAAAVFGAGYGIARAARSAIAALSDAGEGEVPTTTVRRGDVAITVTARGELQGGGARPLVVPRAGTAELPIVFLRATGERVERGDVVVEFDGAAQQYELTEAEADLEEAEQQLLKAEAEAMAALEQARLDLLTAEADLKIAQLDQRDNEFLGAVQQRQNQIALERAGNKHEQAVRDLAHREAARGSGLDAQRAAVQEARAKADAARRTMAELTLRAPAAGYVERAENTSGLTFIFTGMQIPTFQLGDAARPGQIVARIPDMSAWEVSAQIPETDRAFLAVGRPAVVRPRALPGQAFKGRISLLGGSAGSPWNRTFNCRIALDDASDSLRPGMSVNVTLQVETLDDVLWLPSQAVFERDGRRFVYRRAPEGFIAHEVTLVRRTESQAVISGIEEGATIALAEPGRPAESRRSGGPLGAIPR